MNGRLAHISTGDFTGVERILRMLMVSAPVSVWAFDISRHILNTMRHRISRRRLLSRYVNKCVVNLLYRLISFLLISLIFLIILGNGRCMLDVNLNCRLLVNNPLPMLRGLRGMGTVVYCL